MKKSSFISLLVAASATTVASAIYFKKKLSQKTTFIDLPNKTDEDPEPAEISIEETAERKTKDSLTNTLLVGGSAMVQNVKEKLLETKKSIEDAVNSLQGSNDVPIIGEEQPFIDGESEERQLFVKKEEEPTNDKPQPTLDDSSSLESSTAEIEGEPLPQVELANVEPEEITTLKEEQELPSIKAETPTQESSTSKIDEQGQLQQHPMDERDSYFNDQLPLEMHVVTLEDEMAKNAYIINSILTCIYQGQNEINNRIAQEQIEEIVNEVMEIQQENEQPQLEEPLEEISEEDLLLSQLLADDSSELSPIEYSDQPEEILEVISPEEVEETIIEDIIDTFTNEESKKEEEPMQESSIQPPLTEEELLEQQVQQYPNLSRKKIVSISNQVQAMLEAIGKCESISLQHIIHFKDYDSLIRYSSIAAIEGYHYEYSEDKETELYLYSTLDCNESSLTKNILQLAQDVAEYQGSYRGWAVQNTQ